MTILPPVLVDDIWVSIPSGKEETTKKSICIAVAFMLMLIFIGCSATMTPEQRKELYEERKETDLRSSVGNQPFVGDPNNLDARGMMKASWF